MHLLLSPAASHSGCRRNQPLSVAYGELNETRYCSRRTGTDGLAFPPCIVGALVAPRLPLSCKPMTGADYRAVWDTMLCGIPCGVGYHAVWDTMLYHRTLPRDRSQLGRPLPERPVPLSSPCQVRVQLRCRVRAARQPIRSAAMARCMLHGACCMYGVRCSMTHGVRCMLYVACCSMVCTLHVLRCILHVVCCMLRGGAAYATACIAGTFREKLGDSASYRGAAYGREEREGKERAMCACAGVVDEIAGNGGDVPPRRIALGPFPLTPISTYAHSHLRPFPLTPIPTYAHSHLRPFPLTPIAT